MSKKGFRKNRFNSNLEMQFPDRAVPVASPTVTHIDLTDPSLSDEEVLSLAEEAGFDGHTASMLLASLRGNLSDLTERGIDL